jgi:stage III sporulation protein SpoIIIAA
MFVVLRNSAPYYSMYDNESQLKDALIEFLNLHRETLRYYHINYQIMEIEDIISFSMEISREVVNHGIVQIIKGTHIIKGTSLTSIEN